MVPGRCDSGVFGGRLEGECYEGLKTAGLVLSGSQAEQVVHPVLIVLHVAIQHGGIRLEAQSVREGMHLQPALARYLGRADLVPHPLREDLGPTPGQAIESGRLEIPEDLLCRHRLRIGEVDDLGSGECLDVHGRRHLPDPRDHRAYIRVGQRRVLPSDDVDLGGPLLDTRARLGEDFFHGE